MNNEKLIEEFVNFMENNLNLMVTLSGRDQDLKPMFDFVNQQKNLFLDKISMEEQIK